MAAQAIHSHYVAKAGIKLLAQLPLCQAHPIPFLLPGTTPASSTLLFHVSRSGRTMALSLYSGVLSVPWQYAAFEKWSVLQSLFISLVNGKQLSSSATPTPDYFPVHHNQLFSLILKPPTWVLWGPTDKIDSLQAQLLYRNPLAKPCWIYLLWI